ncbi:MAG: DNA-binding protein WhiA [Lachnospiraceae bacterium]|nr:DNA-binding protein WhiA [Lachnospiraceae bacterium]
MSFSSEIKEELSRQMTPARHCQLAELSALLGAVGTRLELEPGKTVVRIHTENLSVARKCFTLLKKTFNIRMDLSVKQSTYGKDRPDGGTDSGTGDSVSGKGHRSYQILVYDSLEAVEHAFVQTACCRRAFIRGAFLAAGSVSDPGKSYHFEIVCDTEGKALQLQEMITSFDIGAKITPRKKKFVVYVKEGSQIVDLLNVMEAHVALMDFENVRILKEVKNSVNRQVNCETANLGKTVSAAMKQIEDIRYIREHHGFQKLSENLAEIAEVRLEHPSASLKELGQMLDPPVGKSGVNHRLRKLSILAEELKAFEEEKYYD